MASTYTDAGIELIGVGEQANTWGETTNTNWRLIEELAAGVTQVSLDSLSSFTLTTSVGALSAGRHFVVEFTGTPSVDAVVTVAPNTLQKVYIINNATDKTVTLTQGTGGDVDVPAGTKKILYCDGQGGTAKVFDVTENFSLSNLTIDGEQVTASVAELNTLDGFTGTTEELNTLDGFTGTTEDFNYAKDLRATGVTVAEFSELSGGISSDGVSTFSSNTTVTVGSGGDYATINDAIEFLSNSIPVYDNSYLTATIELLSGFVIAEQVLVKARNLGWIKITAQDSNVTIDSSALTIDHTFSDYFFTSTPVFGATQGGVLPVIDIFELEFDTLNSGGNKHGVDVIGPGSGAQLAGISAIIGAGGVGVFSRSGAFVDALTSRTRDSGSDDYAVSEGGVISAVNTDSYGTLSQTPNTLTSSGIIYR